MNDRGSERRSSIVIGLSDGRIRGMDAVLAAGRVALELVIVGLSLHARRAR